MAPRPTGRSLESGGTCAFFEMPGTNGNVGKLAAYDVNSMKEVWSVEQRLGTSVQGFPISFSIAGKQYVAVTTGLGGGSPRGVPRTIAPDVRHPQTGNALYVFALE